MHKGQLVERYLHCGGGGKIDEHLVNLTRFRSVKLKQSYEWTFRCSVW